MYAPSPRPCPLTGKVDLVHKPRPCLLAGRCIKEMQVELDSIHCHYAPDTDAFVDAYGSIEYADNPRIAAGPT